MGVLIGIILRTATRLRLRHHGDASKPDGSAAGPETGIVRLMLLISFAATAAIFAAVYLYYTPSG